MTRQDTAFHQGIAKAGGNALFLQIARSFEELMCVAVPTEWQTRTKIAQRDVILAHHRDSGRDRRG